MKKVSSIRFIVNVIIVLSGILVLNFLFFLPLIFWIVDLRFFDPEHMGTLLDRINLILSVVLAISFFIWLYKSTVNKFYIAKISLMDSQDYIGPKMSIAYFFIPILNFYKPYIALVEVHDVLLLKLNKSMRFLRTLILVFWIMFIVNRISAIVFRNAEFSVTFAYMVFVFYFFYFFVWGFIVFRLSNAQLECIAQRQNEVFKKIKFGIVKIFIIFAGFAICTFFMIGQSRKDDDALFADAQAYEDAGYSEDAFKVVEYLADKGNSKAQMELGKAYELGLGIEKDWGKSFEYYLMSAKQGNPYAQNAVGMFYHKGLGEIEKNDEEAVKWLELSGKQGVSLAYLNIARIYTHHNPETKTQKILDYYIKAAKLDNPDAQLDLFEIYSEGLYGAEKNAKTALLWLTKASDKDYAQALNQYGILYYEGRYVKQNNILAISFLEKAAKNLPLAQYNLGWIYGHDEDLRNLEKSFQYFKQASANGYEAATVELADFYAEGLVVEKDVDKAIEMLLPFKENAMAAEILLKIYEGKNDTINAKIWREKAEELRKSNEQQ